MNYYLGIRDSFCFDSGSVLPKSSYGGRNYISSPIPQYSVEEFKRHVFYKNNYDPVGINALHKSCYPAAIGRNSGIRTCRFCLKSRPEVTFRKVAHVIPRFTGNKKWESFEECDSCNSIFAKYESHLSAFTNLERTFGRIKGYRGIPEFQDGSIKVKNSPETDKISLFSGQDTITDGPKDEPNSFDLQYTIPPYRPIDVYKSLTKSALSAWPRKDLKYFDSLRSWLINETTFDNVDDWSNCFCWKSIIGGPFRFSPPFLYLFRRKFGKKVPYATAVMGFGHSVFQIYLPSFEQDSILSGYKFDLMPFVPPTVGMLRSKGCHYSLDATHMNKSELVRGKTSSVRIRYGSRVKLS